MDNLLYLWDNSCWIHSSLSLVGLTRETVWMLQCVSFLSMRIVSIFTGQRNNDWAKLNRDPGSDKLPLTVINGSILWLWETSQYVHEWKNETQANLQASSVSKYHQTQQRIIVVPAKVGYLFIQRDSRKMHECSFFFWIMLYWWDNQYKAFIKATEGGYNNSNTCEINAIQYNNTTNHHLKITKKLKQYLPVTGKRLNIMSFTNKVLQGYCIALDYIICFHSLYFLLYAFPSRFIPQVKTLKAL